ncbi:SatD family protein [Rathayibacter sp. VKM Ac-2630]|uniref:SatD family protein n=1 Tax=Rathayibacter sp. VKM Ac-2630 TaxID=1938617 RepID=UPI0009817C10|nr:SatD family protein [Rathayibacter sp. VKM Ac-2630]OOB90946.1 hypothetical protein B0T42_08835 [Rathayibacter sp. VKM Ac-2630]
MSEAPVVAVLLDLVGSRQLEQRDVIQLEIEAGFASLAEIVPAIEPLHPTVGDEFQAVYSSLPAALRAALHARLSLPDGVDCRVGLGQGEIRVIGLGIAGSLQDGPAWWRARTAINRAHELEDGAVSTARSWFVGPDDPKLEEAAVNAYLLARDALIAPMSARDRRLVLGTMRGTSQKTLAEQESISQSAVSQALRRAGAGALAAGTRLFEDVS